MGIVRDKELQESRRSAFEAVDIGDYVEVVYKTNTGTTRQTNEKVRNVFPGPKDEQLFGRRQRVDFESGKSIELADWLKGVNGQKIGKVYKIKRDRSEIKQ